MTRLTLIERRWAEALFEAILGPVEREGLPSFASIDRAVFWNAVETAPGPTFGLGLRAMVHTLTFLPMARLARPFYALDARDRESFIAWLDARPEYGARQMLASLKVLACFAYFDAESVRSRFATELAS